MPQPKPLHHRLDLTTALVLEETQRTIRQYRLELGQSSRDCACSAGNLCAWHAAAWNDLVLAEDNLTAAIKKLRRNRDE